MKKALGIILIIVGSILLILQVVNTIRGIPTLLEQSGAEGTGFVVGFVVSTLLFILLEIWMIRKGIKLTKQEQKKNFKDQLDEF